MKSRTFRDGCFFAMFAACGLLLTGCGGGRVADAVRGVNELQPKLEKRNSELEDLADPHSINQSP